MMCCPQSPTDDCGECIPHPTRRAAKVLDTTKAALTTATLCRRATMADPDATMIPLELPREEAAAFSQFVKRIDYETVGRFAAAAVTYGGRAEHYVMWCALTTLRHQLAEAGFAPR